MHPRAQRARQHLDRFALDTFAHDDQLQIAVLLSKTGKSAYGDGKALTWLETSDEQYRAPFGQLRRNGASEDVHVRPVRHDPDRFVTHARANAHARSLGHGDALVQPPPNRHTKRHQGRVTTPCETIRREIRVKRAHDRRAGVHRCPARRTGDDRIVCVHQVRCERIESFAHQRFELRLKQMRATAPFARI